MRPLAFFFTWGTYGMRLHGGDRPTVDRENNEYGTPVLGADPERWEEETSLLKFPPRRLTLDQRLRIETLLPSICERGRWQFHTAAARLDHVHAVLTSPFDPETIRKLLKRWLGQELENEFSLLDGETWWAECGSIKWVYDQAYFDNVIGYVNDQRTTPKA